MQGDGVHLYAFEEPAQEIRWRCLMYGWMMVPRLVLCIAFAANVYWAQEWRASRIVSMHYPCLALISKIEGSVLQVTIGEAGKPVEVKALRGHPLLLDGAAENIKKWAFCRRFLGKPQSDEGVRAVSGAVGWEHRRKTKLYGTCGQSSRLVPIPGRDLQTGDAALGHPRRSQ